jgi:hypothetical protein
MNRQAGVVLDAGAFIQLEQGDRTMTHLARRFHEARTPLVTSAGVVAQVWRGGSRGQVPIAFLLRRTLVVDLTHAVAKVLGRMLGATRTRDPIDAHVVLLARDRDWPILTSDPDDLRAIDPTVTIEPLGVRHGPKRVAFASRAGPLRTGPLAWPPVRAPT